MLTLDNFKKTEQTVLCGTRELSVFTVSAEEVTDPITALAALPIAEQIAHVALTDAKPETEEGDCVPLSFIAWNWSGADQIAECNDISAVLATEEGLLLGVVYREKPCFLCRPTVYTVTRYSGDENNGAGYKEGSYYETDIAVTLLPDPTFLDPTTLYRSPLFAELEEFTVPEGTVTLGRSAFYGCKKLKKVTLPASLTHIGFYAFGKCEALEEVVIPADGLKGVDTYAFEGCTSLREITLPDSVTYIGSSVFMHCEKLERIRLPESLTDISNELFYGCYALKGVKIPAGVTTVYSDAFRSCISLTEIELPEATTRLADGVFRGCYRLETVKFSKNLTDFGRRVFDGCEALKKKGT